MLQGFCFPRRWVVSLRLRLGLQKEDGFSGPELGVVELGKVRIHGNQSSLIGRDIAGLPWGLESDQQAQVPYFLSLLGMSEILLDSKSSNYCHQNCYNSYLVCPFDF
jgi:hypothetical protein